MFIASLLNLLAVRLMKMIGIQMEMLKENGDNLYVGYKKLASWRMIFKIVYFPIVIAGLVLFTMFYFSKL